MKLTRTKILSALLAAVASIALFVPIGGAQPYYQGVTGQLVKALTQFQAPAGSASVPAYSFTADPDTGVINSAANVLGFVTGGVERFKMGSAGFTLMGSSSGSTVLKAAAAAGTTTLTLPAGTTDFSATGGTSQVVKQTSSGGAFTVARLACSDLSDSTALCSGSLGTGVATFLATPSSANLAAAVTDETGSGALVFANTPTLVTPVIGAATGTSLALGGDVFLTRQGAKRLLISGDGTGATTNAGVIVGYSGDTGAGAIWASTVTPSNTNMGLYLTSTATYLTVPTGNNVLIGPGTLNVVTVNASGLRTTGYLQAGSATALTLAAGELGLLKITDGAAAPGALGCRLLITGGTNANTGALKIACGTSATLVTVVDNVGAGM